MNRITLIGSLKYAHTCPGRIEPGVLSRRRLPQIVTGAAPVLVKFDKQYACELPPPRPLSLRPPFYSGCDDAAAARPADFFVSSP